MQPGKHGSLGNASWCAGSSVLEIASPSAADVQRSRFGLASGASFTAPWSSVIPRTIFFRALDASTRGFWSVYDSSGLLAQAGLLNHKIGSAARPPQAKELSDTQQVSNSAGRAVSSRAAGASSHLRAAKFSRERRTRHSGARSPSSSSAWCPMFGALAPHVNDRASRGRSEGSAGAGASTEPEPEL